MTLELGDGERVAFDGKATQYRQRTAIRGRLRITNRRVLFAPDVLSIARCPIEIPLTQIAGIRRRKGFALFRTRIILDLEGGARYVFASRQRDRIAQVLKGTRREVAVPTRGRQAAAT